MKSTRSLLWVLVLSACATVEEGGAGDEGTGGTTGSGGDVGTGGTTTGGTTSGSGASASGGVIGVGNSTSSGGAATGGTASGGAATGGAATGGSATGGAATGGASTGGASTGGAASGGAATGGAGTGGGSSSCDGVPQWSSGTSYAQNDFVFTLCKDTATSGSPCYNKPATNHKFQCKNATYSNIDPGTAQGFNAWNLISECP